MKNDKPLLGRLTVLAAAVLFGFLLGASRTAADAARTATWNEYDVHGLIGNGCDKIIAIGLWDTHEIVSCANGRAFFR